MATMRRAVAIPGGGVDTVRVETAEVPTPAKGEALVKLTAATLNFRDLLFATGRLPGMAKEPDYVPLSCGAGEVVALGDGVSRVAVGDRVSPLFSTGWLEGRSPTAEMLGGTADGTARGYIVSPVDSLVAIPDTLGDLEAATLPCAGLTAWNALFLHRPLRSGEWVLLQGTGGVSIAALQFAKAAGARVAITSSSDAKLARARALGADVTVNYRATPDWAAAVKDAIGGANVAILVDVVGATEVEQAAALLSPSGIVAAVGMLGSAFSWDRAEVAGRPVLPISVGNRAEHEAMLAFCAEHAIRPVVDTVYDLSRIQDALRQLESGDFFGKIGINLR